MIQFTVNYNERTKNNVQDEPSLDDLIEIRCVSCGEICYLWDSNMETECNICGLSLDRYTAVLKDKLRGRINYHVRKWQENDELTVKRYWATKLC